MNSRVQQFAALVAGQPENEKFRFSLAQALAADGQTAAAIEHYAFCVRAKPDWMMAQILLGKSLLALGRRTDAKPHLEAALTLAVEQNHEEPEREMRALLADL